MTALHAQIIERNGQREYAVIPYSEFLKLQEELENYEDMKLLRQAQAEERDAPVMTFAEVKRKLPAGGLVRRPGSRNGK